MNPPPHSFPPGYLSADIGYRVIIVAAVFIPICIIFVALRFYSQALRQAPRGLDDILVVVSAVMLIGWSILAICKSRAAISRFDLFLIRWHRHGTIRRRRPTSGRRGNARSRDGDGVLQIPLGAGVLLLHLGGGPQTGRVGSLQPPSDTGTLPHPHPDNSRGPHSLGYCYRRNGLEPLSSIRGELESVSPWRIVLESAGLLHLCVLAEYHHRCLDAGPASACCLETPSVRESQAGSGSDLLDRKCVSRK